MLEGRISRVNIQIIIFNKMDWQLLMLVVVVNSIRNHRFVRLNRNSINK